jgi:hypothetical protein
MKQGNQKLYIDELQRNYDISLNIEGIIIEGISDFGLLIKRILLRIILLTLLHEKVEKLKQYT